MFCLLLHAALGDLVLQPVSQLLIALVGLLHLSVELVHAVGELAGHALHEIAHLLVIGFELFGETVEFIAQRFLFFGRELEGIGRIFIEQFAPFFVRFAQKIAHAFDRALAVFRRKAAAHEVAQRAPHAFFFEQMIGKMLEEIVRRGEKNFLRAVPLSVTMDSHLVLTIAQFGGVSNPNFCFKVQLSVAFCASAHPLELTPISDS